MRHGITSFNPFWFSVVAALGFAACADVPPPEAISVTATSDDPGKADAAGPIRIVGGLTLEDSRAVTLPAAPVYAGLVILAPAGADLTVGAAGRFATRVTAFGPRRGDGSYGPALGSEPGSLRFKASEDGAYLVVPQPRYVGQTGATTVTVTCSGTRCLGSCSAKAPTLSRRKWVHTTKSPLVTVLGGARHRAYDQVAAEDDDLTLSARFTYGAVDKDLEDEDVDLWVRTCPGWVKLATARTDDDGIATVDIKTPLAPGDYHVLWHVPGDGSTAAGTLAIWEAERPIVVTDIDGTLTINDTQLFKEIFLGSDPKHYADAQSALWLVRRKGYRIQYLSGRPESLGGATKGWLARHGFPPGPVRLTDETLEVLPFDSGVGDFKVRALAHLTNEVGAWVYAGFGNAPTDIFAYSEGGVPKDHVFIIGTHAGEEGTTAVQSYTTELEVLGLWPETPTP